MRGLRSGPGRQVSSFMPADAGEDDHDLPMNTERPRTVVAQPPRMCRLRCLRPATPTDHQRIAPARSRPLCSRRRGVSAAAQGALGGATDPLDTDPPSASTATVGAAAVGIAARSR